MLMYQRFLKGQGWKNPHFFCVVFNANQLSTYPLIDAPVGSTDLISFGRCGASASG